MRTISKRNLIFLASLFVSFLGLCTAQATDVSELATYSSDKFGIEFQYPKIFKEYQEKYNKCGIKESERRIVLGSSIGITITDSETLTLDEYVDKYIKERFGPDSGVKVFEEGREETSVAGERAIQLTYQVGGMGRAGVSVFVIHKNKGYNFSFVAAVPCMPELDITELGVMYQVLSTFKFMDQ